MRTRQIHDAVFSVSDTAITCSTCLLSMKKDTDLRLFPQTWLVHHSANWMKKGFQRLECLGTITLQLYRSQTIDKLSPSLSLQARLPPGMSML